ncbi:MAG: hypothetical protein IJS44_04005 [Clostridia bacterium]|nr:hypothetical protein [Clostridia bacterium]
MVHQKKAAEGLLFSSKPAKTAWYVISRFARCMASPTGAWHHGKAVYVRRRLDDMHPFGMIPYNAFGVDDIQSLRTDSKARTPRPSP